MKKKNKGLLILVLLLVVTIGIGYASTITDSVNITGTASADTDFDIQFSNVASDIVTNTGNEDNTSSTNTDKKVEAAYTDVDNATIKVTGLKYVGDYGEATFTILNKSTDLKANITASIKSAITDTTHYEVTTTMGTGSDSVAAKSGSTTVTVKVKLIKAFDDTDKAKTDQKFTVTATGTAVEE